jgi:hypothetical protein
MMDATESRKKRPLQQHSMIAPFAAALREA